MNLLLIEWQVACDFDHVFQDQVTGLSRLKEDSFCTANLEYLCLLNM